MTGMNGLQVVGIVALIAAIILAIEFGLTVLIGKFISVGHGRTQWDQPIQWDETDTLPAMGAALKPGVKWGTRTDSDGNETSLHPTLSDFDRHVSEAMDQARGI